MENKFKWWQTGTLRDTRDKNDERIVVVVRGERSKITKMVRQQRNEGELNNRTEKKESILSL